MVMNVGGRAVVSRSRHEARLGLVTSALRDAHSAVEHAEEIVDTRRSTLRMIGS